MTYYKDSQNNVYAYDKSQIDLVVDKTPMTVEEVEAHINPVQTELELTAQKVQEVIAFLIATNHKDFPRYIPKEGEDMEALYTKREEALLFIRENK